jgi:glycyl-tRNA synthetase (class II)
MISRYFWVVINPSIGIDRILYAHHKGSRYGIADHKHTIPRIACLDRERIAAAKKWSLYRIKINMDKHDHLGFERHDAKSHLGF